MNKFELWRAADRLREEARRLGLRAYDVRWWAQFVRLEGDRGFLPECDYLALRDGRWHAVWFPGNPPDIIPGDWAGSGSRFGPDPGLSWKDVEWRLLPEQRNRLEARLRAQVEAAEQEAARLEAEADRLREEAARLEAEANRLDRESKRQ